MSDDIVPEEVPQLDHPALRETGNGPSVSYESDLLEQYFGPAVDGVYYGAAVE